MMFVLLILFLSSVKCSGRRNIYLKYELLNLPFSWSHARTNIWEALAFFHSYYICTCRFFLFTKNLEKYSTSAYFDIRNRTKYLSHLIREPHTLLERKVKKCVSTFKLCSIRIRSITNDYVIRLQKKYCLIVVFLFLHNL